MHVWLVWFILYIVVSGRLMGRRLRLLPTSASIYLVLNLKCIEISVLIVYVCRCECLMVRCMLVCACLRFWHVHILLGFACWTHNKKKIKKQNIWAPAIHYIITYINIHTIQCTYMYRPIRNWIAFVCIGWLVGHTPQINTYWYLAYILHARSYTQLLLYQTIYMIDLRIYL